MPKKRKARRPNIPLYTGPVSPAEPAAEAPAKADGLRLAPSGRTSGATSQIKADYTHVIGDLKRIALYGGGLIAVLIGLSFFIR